MEEKKEDQVHSAIGDGKLDGNGAAVAVTRMGVEKSYQGIDLLLRKFIRDSDRTAWDEIKAKIDYTYKNLDGALSALEKEEGFLAAIKKRLQQGQKLLFKPNLVAQMMSQSAKEREDPFSPGLMWGKGKWPSYSLAYDRYVKQIVYGWKYPARIGISSLYGSACAFADFRQNGRKFVGSVRGVPDPEAAQKYVEAVRNKDMAPLDFTFFVPTGYVGKDLPNVQESVDPGRVFTVLFEGGSLKWPDVRTQDLEIDR